MTSEITYLFTGFVLGLSAGLSPGPLLTLVISETLKHSAKEGIKVAIAPLMSDLPIVLTTFFILSRLSNMQPVLGTISVAGALFLVYLGCESIFFKGIDIETENVKPQSIKKGIIANFLNPNPYMFWFTIGTPTVLKALKVNILSASLYIISFYLLLVGSKVLIAIVVGKSRFFLKSNNYIYTIRILGIILLLFAIMFLKDGYKFWFGVQPSS